MIGSSPEQMRLRDLLLEGAGEGIRTLNPVRGAVFETAAYTVPPRRLEVAAVVYAI